MKKIIIITIAGITALVSCKGTEATTVGSFDALSSKNDSLSYFLGTDIAGKFLSSKIDKVYDATSFAKGLQDAFSKSEFIVKGEEIQSTLIGKFQALNGDTNTTTYVGSEMTSFDGLNTIDDTISYVIGTDVARGLTSNGFDKSFSENAFLSGINDMMSKKPLQINEQEWQMKAQQTVDANGKILAKVGEDFLIAKSSEEDVITLPSGLRYKVLNEGNGAMPQATDRVKAHYHGTLIDGTVFDSSVERGQPLEIGVNEVIPGWTEALQLMPIGSKWELYIPYNMAYGERGSQAIPPYSALIFQVELLEILPAATQPLPGMQPIAQ